MHVIFIPVTLTSNSYSSSRTVQAFCVTTLTTAVFFLNYILVWYTSPICATKSYGSPTYFVVFETVLFIKIIHAWIEGSFLC